MTVTHNKEVDEAIRDLAQTLKGDKKKKFMSVVVELGNRVRECERYRGRPKKSKSPLISDYAKSLVHKKKLDEMKGEPKTNKDGLDVFIDPERVNCNQHL